MLDAADDLYHLRIPAHWRHLAGTAAPPSKQSLATWVADLQNRVQHFEKILVLVSGGTQLKRLRMSFLGRFYLLQRSNDPDYVYQIVSN